MNDCKISIDAPKIFLKGAGFPNTSFLPAWIYKVKITLKNSSDFPQLCSFSATMGNGIRYIKKLQLSGPDTNIYDSVNIVEPTQSVGNNNVIIFANNFTLSANSENILSLNTCLCDNLTEKSIENSGAKIPHNEKIFFYGHLINGENVDSCSYVTKACDYKIQVKCEDNKICKDDTTKFYIECCTGQYDMVRSVYVRSILDEGLEFIADSSNMEPRNIYTFDKKTILKWNVGSLQPCEVKKIGYKVNINEANLENGLMKKGSILKNKINSNCINNSTYTQCPSSCEYELLIE
ncbi:hypothetical protein J2Z76_002867 [Sedimentibacter acidaminivorans]|uniref:Uncharacterized protein n=1 Tax=Sedimentibacter acidaminivorans TaxID=913099 RepID=A0ABS4GH30_9FIRM|nr:hypothetical protein [Sedimentibacter acidaminivorans]MBP1926995.1 hypothetical protein [Sedimentibacter acidaminivorans]